MKSLSRQTSQRSCHLSLGVVRPWSRWGQGLDDTSIAGARSGLAGESSDSFAEFKYGSDFLVVSLTVRTGYS